GKIPASIQHAQTSSQRDGVGHDICPVHDGTHRQGNTVARKAIDTIEHPDEFTEADWGDYDQFGIFKHIECRFCLNDIVTNDHPDEQVGVSGDLHLATQPSPSLWPRSSPQSWPLCPSFRRGCRRRPSNCLSFWLRELPAGRPVTIQLRSSVQALRRGVAAVPSSG